MNPYSQPPESRLPQGPRIEPGRLQFIEQNFREYLQGRDRLQRIEQIHRWLFIECKPVSIVRQKLAATHHRAGVIAMTSGKGGVGKTTTSVNLSVTLARMGWKILLFDADLGMANTHIFAGVSPRYTVVDVLRQRAALEETVVSGPEGISVICGASGVSWLADLDVAQLTVLSRDLRQFADGYDFLIIDTGAGISAQVLHFLSLANDIVVVTTPNLAATLDGYGIVKAAHEAGLTANVHLIVNQAQDETEAQAVAKRITDCAERFLQRQAVPLGYLTRDVLVEMANQNRRPLVHLHPGSTNVVRLQEMALRLCGLPPGGDAAALSRSPAETGTQKSYSNAAA